MKKIITRAISFVVAVLLLSIPIEVLACACPESNFGEMRYYTSCSNGCWYRNCLTHTSEATGSHNSLGTGAHGKCVVHTCVYCSVCGINTCISSAHNPCTHGTCAHACKTHHADHCLTCHNAPCICYPAASNISIPTGWYKQLTVNISNSNGALGHKIYGADKGLLQDYNSASCTFDVTDNGTWYVRPYNARGENPIFQEIKITNIDHEVPNILEIKGNPIDWTKDNVLIEISAEDTGSGLHPQAYSFDGGLTWQGENTFRYSDNGLISNVKVRDALENTIDVTPFEITKIDKAMPVVDASAPPSVSENGDSIISCFIEDIDSGLTDNFELTTWVISNKAATTHTVTLPYVTTKTRAVLNSKKQAVFELGVKNNPNIKPGDVIAGEVIVTDLAQNKSTYAIAEMTLDNIAPTISGVNVSSAWSSLSNGVNVSAIDNETSVTAWGFSHSEGKETVQWLATNQFNITENGTYFAFAKDLNGNVSAPFKFTVANIDKSAPTITAISHNKVYTGKSYDFAISATDSGSGVVAYSLSNTTTLSAEWKADNKFTVTRNGTYYAFAKDAAGNVSAPFPVAVSYIDKSAPTLKYNMQTTWTNKNVNISFDAIDDMAGIKSITLPNGSTISEKSFSFEFSENGQFDFVLSDNAGNTATYTVEVSCIDRLKPKITYDIVENKTDKTVTIFIAAADTLSGMGRIFMPNNTTAVGTQAKLTVNENGSYVIKAVDNAGNEISQKIVVDAKLLKKIPDKKASGIKLSWIGLSIAGAVGIAGAGAGATALSSAALNNLLGGGSGGIFLSYLFAGADAIAIDHKRSKKYRIKICEGIIDLTLAVEQAKTNHFTIILSKKYARKNMGQVVKVVIEGALVSSTVLKDDTLKIVI